MVKNEYEYAEKYDDVDEIMRCHFLFSFLCTWLRTAYNARPQTGQRNEVVILLNMIIFMIIINASSCL